MLPYIAYMDPMGTYKSPILCLNQSPVLAEFPTWESVFKSLQWLSPTENQGPEIDCPKYGLVNTQMGQVSPFMWINSPQILPGKRIFVVIHSEFRYEFRYVSPPVSPKMPIVH